MATELGTSLCVKSDGEKVMLPDLVVAANRIYNFVEANRTAYFEQHSLEWALDEILNRGIAEIKRAIKTGVKREADVAAGKAVKQLNLTPAQMVAEFLRLKALEASAANAAAEAAKPTPDAKPKK